MAVKRRRGTSDEYSLQNITNKTHHLLGNEEDKIIIFGDDKAVQRLAASRVINADGTFKCVLEGFSQLYIFHATVENNLSLPVFFCLVKGKDEQSHAKLLSLVETLANDAGISVFNGDVQLMCDFELALINAVQILYQLVKVKCCLFHFAQGVFRNSRKAVEVVKSCRSEIPDAQDCGESRATPYETPACPRGAHHPRACHLDFGAIGR